MIDGTILGIISWYACSSYDMRAELEHGGADMLSALSIGSINPRLKALEREGLIETRDESTGARPRKVHELTAAGWEALMAMPVGVLLGGYRTDMFGVQPIFFGIAACYLTVTLSMRFYPVLRQMNAPAQAPSLEPAQISAVGS